MHRMSRIKTQHRHDGRFSSPILFILFIHVGSSKDAEQECAAFHKRTGRIIKLLAVQEILDEEFVQKM